jgi:hypothetical protein
MYLRSYVPNQRIDRSTSAQTLPFLRVLVAVCAHPRVMTDAILVDRLVRAVVPYLSKLMLPQPEAMGTGAAGISGSKRKELEGVKVTK